MQLAAPERHDVAAAAHLRRVENVTSTRLMSPEPGLARKELGA